MRYLSRLGDEIDNWAIFDGNHPENTTSEPIAADDADLAAALAKLDLELGAYGR